VRFVDFANSYLTFSVGDEQNIARIQLDAVCTVYDERAGETTAYHLIAPCRSERMYSAPGEPLFQMPNYEFCGVWTEREYRIVRTGWTSDRDNPESGESAGRFAWTRLDLRTRDDPLELATDAEVVTATLANRPLVAITELQDETSGRRAVLEYPVKTMNVARSPDRFQVDTGPLLLPDFASTAPRGVDRLDLAHVVYWRRDVAEFVLRRPIPVRPGSDVAVTDYGEIRIIPALNRLLTVDPT
jgi:hypothetical protein